MSKFSDVLSRMSEDVIQDLLGSSMLKLLRLSDTKRSEFIFYREILIQLHTEEGMLLDKKIRNAMIDLLKPEELTRLADVMSVKATSIDKLYETLKTKSLRRGSLKERIFFEFFNLTPPAIQNVQSNLAINEQMPAYPLFSHQRRAVFDIEQMLNQEPYRALLHMPTGSGKTRTAMNVIANHFRGNENTFVIWLAASEELCEQAAEEFENSWSFLGDRSLQVYRFWGTHMVNFRNLKEGIMIAGLQKLHSALQREDSDLFLSLANRVKLIVMDEAHQAVAPTYETKLNILFLYNQNENNKKSLLGLSATPGKTWNDPELDRKLSDFFRRKKVKLRVDGYESPVDYLVAEHYLAEVNYRKIEYDKGNLTQSDLKSITGQLEIPQEILKKLGKDEKRNLSIVREIQRLMLQHKRIIVFAPSVESSNVIAGVLQSKKIRAFSVTSQTDSEVRRSIIQQFKSDSKERMILCNYGVLTTGFDAPKTSAAIIARPTLSLVLYSQMIGRAIRGLKAGGNKTAEIVTVVDHHLPGFNSVREAFENWEDIWEEEKSKEETNK